MGVGVVLLAHGTALDILLHELHETQPPEFRGDELASLEITWVTGSFVVVTAGEDGAVEGVLQGNIDIVLVCQDMVIKLPVRKVRPEDDGDVFQGQL